MMNRHRHVKGFSLLELLLATAVFFSLLIAVFMLLQTYAERELARATNKYMVSVADATREILDNIDNFNALYLAAVANGGGYQLIADSSAPAQDNIAKTFTVGSTTIQASRLLNAQFRATSPLRAPVRIMLRVADNMASSTDTPALDVLIVTATPRPDGLVRRAASEAGANGGYIRTYSDKASADVVSAYGSWHVKPSAGLQSTAWYQNELKGSLSSFTDGSYLVYYMYSNIEDVGGDYLYRVKDVDPALHRNTMYGDFNIGGNDVYGGDDINVGNDTSAHPFVTGDATVPDECEGGVMCVNGTAILKGSGSIAGTMTTQGSALIADSSSVKSLRIQNGLDAAQKDAYGAQSMFVIDGNGQTSPSVQDEIDVGTNAKFVDGATVNAGNLATIQGTTVTMPDGGVLNARDVLNTRRVSGTTIDAKSMVVNDVLKSGIVSGGNVNVASGRAGVIDIRESQNMTYGSAAAPRKVSVPKLNVGTMNISNFGTCTTGCQQ
jgi:hypothetical protein